MNSEDLLEPGFGGFLIENAIGGVPGNCAQTTRLRGLKCIGDVFSFSFDEQGVSNKGP